MSDKDNEAAVALNGTGREIRYPSDVIGGWGPVQRNIFVFLTIVYILAPFQNGHIVFTVPITNFTCIVNDSFTDTLLHLNNSCYDNNSTKCEKFEHDKSWHERTLVNTFDLVCDRAWLGSASQSVHQIGYAVSGLLLGFISDNYGRFFCAKLAIAMEIVAGFGQAFAPSIYVYMFARFFVGVAAYGRFLNGYVLIAEWVGPKIRGRMAAVHELFGWSLGKLALPWAFYYLPDYFTMQVGLSTTQVFLFVIYIFVIHESPRWLLTNGKYAEAEKILQKAAKEKGKYSEEEVRRRVHLLKEHFMEEKAKLEKEQHSRVSVFEVWKDPKLLRLSIILYYSWFSKNLVGLGTYFNIPNLGGNLYVNVFIIDGCSGVISNLLQYVLIRRMARLKLIIMCVILQAIFFMGVFACSFDNSLIPLRIFLNFLASIMVTLVSDTLYVYTTETFPTTMRQVQIGTCALFSRIGSVSAPFIKELTLATHLSVSVGLFVILSIVNSILLFLLPDTTDIQLPDNVVQTRNVVETDLKRRRSSLGVTQRPSK